MSPLFPEGIKKGFIKDLTDGERETESEASRSKGMEAGYYDANVLPPPGNVLSNDSCDP